MLKLRTGTIRIRTWFPPDDPLAEIVARLCILREDLALEMHGLDEKELGGLDGNSEEWRRVYFLRSLIRTMKEITHALEALSRNPEFKHILGTSPAKYRTEFKRVVRGMNSSRGTVKRIRDSLGGHVLSSVIRTALREMPYERIGLLQAGPTGGITHFKFAGEIVVGVLMAGVPEEDQLARFRQELEQVSELLSFHTLIDWVLLAYAKARDLHFQ